MSASFGRYIGVMTFEQERDEIASVVMEMRTNIRTDPMMNADGVTKE